MTRNADREDYFTEQLLDAIEAVVASLDSIHDRLTEIQRTLDYRASK